jgi:hypothetical protein
MVKKAIKHRALLVALALAGTTAAQTATGTTDPNAAPAGGTATTAAASPGQTRVANKFAAPFVSLAGSTENAAALANALRTGTAATLTYTSVDAKGVTTTTTVTITLPTKPMGWGNVSHSLALAQFALNQAGITHPTGPQLQAALLGGSVTTADGKTVALAGVLQQRADGMGWGQIAQSYGTTMGSVNRGIKAPTTAVAASTTTTKTASTGVAPKATSAHGVTTAGGSAASSGHGTKGLTTAAGANGRANSDGIVNAASGSGGNGNAYGRGVVTASGASVGTGPSVGSGGGASNGMVTGAGGATGVVTADPGRGSGNSAHGKGKGGG